jgi:hypothetical protein
MPFDSVDEIFLHQTPAIRCLPAQLSAPQAPGAADVASEDEIDVGQLARFARQRAAIEEDVQRWSSTPLAHQDGIDLHRELPAATSGAITPSQRAQTSQSSRWRGIGDSQRQATITAPE